MLPVFTFFVGTGQWYAMPEFQHFYKTINYETTTIFIGNSGLFLLL